MATTVSELIARVLNVAKTKVRVELDSIPLATGAATLAEQQAQTALLTPVVKAIYSASSTYTPPANPTELFRIRGSATVTVKVRRISLSCTQTTAGSNLFYLLKRSAANTGGSLSAALAAPHDSTSPASATVAGHYTANPSALGASVGNIDIFSLFCPAPATASKGARYERVFDFSEGNEIVLRGTAQTLAFNFNGAALPAGLVVNTSITWSEE